MAQPVIVQGMKLFFVDLIGGILGFPVWWYSRGLVKWVRGLWSWYRGYAARLAVGVWVKNLFVPMYGTHDLAGRLISFFMRLAMIVIRSIAMVFLAIGLLVLFLAYLALPLAVAGMVLYHAVGMITV